MGQQWANLGLPRLEQTTLNNGPIARASQIGLYCNDKINYYQIMKKSKYDVMFV